MTTTLGRGGSDYSAALLSRALSAKCLQIWTDVDGVFTCDPRLISSAQTISSLSQLVVAELAYWGAKVLHPATLLPLLNLPIQIQVKNTFNPKASGTLISSSSPPSSSSSFPSQNSSVQALTLRSEQILVTLLRVKKHNTYGFLAEVFSILTKYQVSVDHVTTSEISTSFTLYEPTRLTKQLMDELQDLAEVKVEDKLSLISIIGERLIEIPGVLEQLWEVINGHQIRSFYMGASKNNISFLTREEDAQMLLTKLHQKYFETATNKNKDNNKDEDRDEDRDKDKDK